MTAEIDIDLQVKHLFACSFREVVMKFKDAEVIGHRGAAALAAENTKEAFEKAIEANLNWVETDVRLSRDGRLVLWHDACIEDLPIESSNLDTLREAAGGHLMTLCQALDQFSPELHFNLDMKSHTALPFVVQELKARNLEHCTLLSSFHHKAMVEGQYAHRDMLFAPILASRPASTLSFLSWFKHMKFIVCDIDFIDLAMIDEIKKLGFQLYLYNVHFKEQAAAFIEAGVNAIIVDNPIVFME